MSRRVRTLLVGGVLFLVMVVVAVTVPVPYAILSPGPTLNTLGTFDGKDIIVISDGGNAKPTSGHLNLTTVSIVSGRVSAAQALLGWLAGDKVVVPRETIIPPGVSQQQVDTRDREDFSDSQINAEAAAFCQLDYPKYFGVLGVATDIDPAGALQVGDKLVTMDGADIGSQDALQKALGTHKAGDRVSIAVERDGKPLTTAVVLKAPATGSTLPRIGITIGTSCFAPFKVSLGLNDAIGGPSAGMMFALGIMEKLGTDLTGGHFIAGTGTIDPDGAVGAIGGIQLKMIAARRAGATLFLAPADNCNDVRGNIPKGLTVAKVSTLKQAVQDLQDVKAGKSVPSC